MTGEKINIGGLDVTVVSDEEAEKVDFVVCAPWSQPAYFPDDERGTCCACGVAVRFRPHAPKRPPRLCIKCALTRAAGLQ